MVRRCDDERGGTNAHPPNAGGMTASETLPREGEVRSRGRAGLGRRVALRDWGAVWGACGPSVLVVLLGVFSLGRLCG